MLTEEETILTVAALLTYRTTVEGSACYRPLADVQNELAQVSALLKKLGSLNAPDPPSHVRERLRETFDRTVRSVLFSAQRGFKACVASTAADFAHTCKLVGLNQEEAKACLIELEIASNVSLPPFSELLACYSQPSAPADVC